jgi:hypothetical protein
VTDSPVDPSALTSLPLPPELQGAQVVIDTDAPYSFIGRLEDADARFLRLALADVHALKTSARSVEAYAVEAKKIGIRPNRRTVWIRWERVVSVSRLEDVI